MLKRKAQDPNMASPTGKTLRDEEPEKKEKPCTG